ncbi:glycine betaine/proline transport system substrate-binding protein [Roseovarius halotolerans]|uniref:Glycine betaine transporter periplasmic subunit n=1 Tax=Roseovarius halotolerans TaxID=505353 RepID=A0A1X6ZS50_9RHOB|nr:ABC transporter substrate-binding protein [Roseovarius halotolerans]RKT27906.1 glycine betaine/proline transport system substrate-binding protein [Roseovarius halotolerans]SLN59681.1 glycine betaine transporter periplasmic subunit [Roseovarius halotolerans]
MRLSTFAAAACAGLVMAGSAFAEAESQEPIKLTMHDWTGQLLTTTIMGKVLAEAGYNVEYVQADYIAQFAGLKSGDLHVAMEIWETTGREAMDEAIGTGQVVNMGDTGMKAIEEWWYPAYMEEVCPGLPDWQALNDCAREFATPETAPMGRYLGGPVTWGGFDEERIESLGLDFEVVHAGTDAALFAELESAYQRKAPIVLWIYAPHWAPTKYEGNFVAFPPYTPECYEDPSVGINPNMAYDCGKPTGPIWKVAWSGLADKWPGAAKAVEAFTISNEDMGAMVSAVDLDGKSLDEVSDAWLAANSSVWQSWIAN